MSEPTPTPPTPRPAAGLAADLSHLPRAADAQRGTGWKPDQEPRFVHLLVQRWADEDAAEGPRALAHAGARFRHSDAGKCARALAYAALQLPDSNPMDLSGTWNVRLGTLIHDAWQEVLEDVFGPDAQVEVKVRSLDGDGAGHMDALVTIPVGHPLHPGTVDRPWVVSIEGKSIGGFGFKGAVGAAGRGRPAEGPKHEHVVQGALNASLADADELVVCYWSKEAVSVNQAKSYRLSTLDRFVAEWTLTRDEYEPVARAELDRVAGILALLDSGTLPARKFPEPSLPAGHVIVDPGAGRWEVARGGQIMDTGTWWACSYCRWQDRCVSTPAGRCEVAVALPELDPGKATDDDVVAAVRHTLEVADADHLAVTVDGVEAPWPAERVIGLVAMDGADRRWVDHPTGSGQCLQVTTDPVDGPVTYLLPTVLREVVA